MKRYITEEGLEQLSNYKYKPGGWTWLDSKMNYFWEWAVKQVPLWVAPNLLTFIGWLFVIASYAIMLFYDYTFKKTIPSWCFYFAFLCIFIYSTLDAIDGKQARRTKSSSPLGQLFDHGCDSFSVTFFLLAICQATKLEPHEVFLLFLTAQTAYWISHWTENKTGVLLTGVGQFGVTEGEFTCALIHLLTGIFGQDVWSVKIVSFLPSSLVNGIYAIFQTSEFLEIKFGTILVYFFSVLIFVLCCVMLVKTANSSSNAKQIIIEFIPFVILVSIEIFWVQLDFYQEYSGIVLVNFGLISSLMICKIIICSVTKMHLSVFHQELLPSVISTSLIVFFGGKTNSEREIIIIFWLTFLTNLLLIIYFLQKTIQQITNHLGIYCFSIIQQKKI